MAIAGEVYDGFAKGGEDDPGPASIWRKALGDNEAARQGRFGLGPLKIGAAEQRRTAMEDRFGAMAEAVLATKFLIVDPESRWKLVEALAGALDDGTLCPCL